MKTLGTTLALLFGVTQGVRVSQTRLSKTHNNLDFAEVSSEAGASHTCTFAIDRINNGYANFKSITGSGQKYTDSSFAPDSEMIRWSDRPGSYSLTNYASKCTFSRL